MARKLIVEIIGDASALERSFARAQRSTRGFDRGMRQASRGALAASVSFRGLGRSLAFASGAFLGGAGFIAVAKSSVSAASNLAEQTSKTNVVFGESARIVKSWSRTTATSMGLAQDQALETAGSLGALLRPLGVLDREAANQSKQLTKLGADLASFYNTDVQSALDAIRSGLVGEAEPLRRYGILLSETRVKQVALAQTGKQTAESLTNQEKALARIRIIFKDTAVAQGDFARTSGGLANQQRILSANLRQLQIVIGKALIPDVLNVVRAMNDWLGKSENQRRVTLAVRDAVAKAREAIKTLAEVARTARDAFKVFAEAVGSSKDAILLLTGAFVGLKALRMVAAINPITAAIVAIGAAAEVAALKIKALQEQALAAESRVIAPGQRTETVLVPRLAAMIAAYKDAGKKSNEIIEILRKFLGGGGDAANDLIGKAFAFGSGADPKLTARITKAAAVAKKSAKETGAKVGKATVEGFNLGLKSGGFDLTRLDLPGLLSGIGKGGIPGGAAGTGRFGAEFAAFRQRQQFRALGLTGAGEELAPTRNALREQLGKVSASLKGSILDPTQSNMLRNVRRVLGKEFDSLTRLTRLKVKDLLDALAGTKGGLLDPTAFRHISGSKFLDQAGVNLGAAAQRRFNVAFAQLGPGGTVPSRRSAAFSGAGARQPLHVHVNVDGREVAVATLPHIEDIGAKWSRSRPQIRRGAR